MNNKYTADTKSGSKENGTSKILVRNCRSRATIPMTKPVSQNAALSECEPNRTCSAISKTTNINLAEPQYLTTNLMKENLERMKVGMKSVRFEHKSSEDTHSKGVARKVNIPFDEKIYKDLIDLKVTDEDLGLRPISTSKPKELSRNREPAPELSDYYQPKFNKEYVVKPHQPNWTNIARSRKPPDNQSSVLKAVKRWNVDDNT